MRLFGGMDEVAIKQFIEPPLAALAGAVLYLGSPPLGFFIIIAAVCKGLNVSLILSWERQRATAMNDALIEQQILSERVRSPRTKRW